MRNDHKVNFLSEEAISKHSMLWREKAMRLERAEYLVVAKFILAQMVGQYKKNEIPLDLHLFDKTYSENRLAFVRFDDFSLNVLRTVWDKAILGYPYENYVMAHELGHIILHDYQAQAFSYDSDQLRRKWPKEETAEWQANIFASNLLLPESFVSPAADPAVITVLFGIPEDIVEDRIFESGKSAIRRGKTNFAPYSCPNCGKMQVMRQGNELICIYCRPPYTLQSAKDI